MESQLLWPHRTGHALRVRRNRGNAVHVMLCPISASCKGMACAARPVLLEFIKQVLLKKQSRSSLTSIFGAHEDTGSKEPAKQNEVPGIVAS